MSTAPQPASSRIQIVNGSFDPEKHVYYNVAGVERPSTTQILDSVGLVDYDAVPGDTLEHKRQIGDAVHEATHFLDQDDLNWDTVQEEWAGYLLAYDNFKDECQFVPDGVEEAGIHSVGGMEFGYRRDRTGRIKGINHRIVLEIKCAYREEPSWKYQLAAYAMTVKKQPGEHVGLVAVQLKKDGRFKTYLYENARDRDRFLWALGIVYTKIDEGLKWKRN